MKPIMNTFKHPPLPLATLALALLCAFTLSACGPADKAVSATPAAEAPATDPLEVRVKPEMAAQFQVQKLAPVALVPTQDVAGRIEANAGRVTDVLAEVGDRVKTGQALAYVASPELTTAQLAFLRAHAASQLAERAVERARQLIQADVIGSAELQRRESELSIARAELRAAGDQLQLMGLPAGAIEQLRSQGTLAAKTAVVATLSGVVIERQVSRGQVAQPGDPLFTVADLGNVWVVGGLPEQAARSVQPGQAVEIEVPALGAQRLQGKIVYVGDTVSPETRTVTIRTQVDNTRRDLKPQMLATMRIAAAPQQVLAVPAAAVVRENDRDHVFVRQAEGRYRLTPVELGAASGALRPLLKGLPEGSEVVVEGAFHLNNERKRAELE